MSIIQNNNIRVSEMDFDSIKTSFKDYLKSQIEFADYDFDASGTSFLLDILAYNTYYNSVTANFIANETYLDSAIKRNSVVSLAKSLGYRPKSARSSRAKISMQLINAVGEPDQLVMKAGTPFETTVKQNTYQFVSMSDIISINNNGLYVFPTFEVWEGDFQTNTFIASGTTAERFILPNANVDTSSIRVIVQESSSNLTYSYYQQADSIVSISGDDSVFFIQEGLSNLTEIYFGDGIIGKQLAAGNVVIFTYLTTTGSAANGAKIFNLTGSVEGNNDVEITTISQASGGADVEDIDSIKFNASTYFSVQNRAVTANDYKSLLQQNFQNIKTIITWGGEKNNPPKYGKIFICIQPQNAEFLTSTEISELTGIISSKAVANITPEFVNPDYIDVEILTEVFYDIVKNDKNSAQLKTLIQNQINKYASSYLGKFDSTFRYSQLTKLIDQSDPSILNSLTTISVYKELLPIIDQKNSFVFSFFNQINTTATNPIYSTGFNIGGVSQTVYIQDDKRGNLQLYYIDTLGNKRVVNSNIGSVDYSTGTVNIRSVEITAYINDSIKIYMTPLKNNVLSNNNNIVRIKQDDITISLTPDSGAV